MAAYNYTEQYTDCTKPMTARCKMSEFVSS